MPYVYLLVAIFAEVVATSLLKASDGMSRTWPTVGSLAGYGVAFYFLSITLKTIPTGIAYALWSGIGIVAISLVSWVFFKQALDAAALIGMGLIVVGVAVIQLGSKVAGH